MKKTIIFTIILLAFSSITFAKTAEPFEVQDTVSNSFIKIACGTDGKFTIGTADGRRLLYGFPNEGSTSHTNLIVGSDTLGYGNWTSWGVAGTITEALHRDGDALEMTFTHADVDITQRLSIVEGASTGNDDTILIEYYIYNGSSATTSVGVLLEMDTQIHYNDAAEISTSFGYTGNEQDFTPPNMPQYWQAFEQSPTQPESLLVGQGTLIGSNAVMPDRFCLGQWGTYDDVKWNYTSGSSPYGDSAVLLWWYPVAISPGSTYRVATLYGIGAGSVAIGELALNITAPLSLSVDSVAGEYSPNPFTVNCLVTNTTSATIDGITATIDLPAGLHLASGETATKDVDPSSLDASQTGSVSWNVVADDRSSTATLEYTVTANGGGYSNDMNRTITVPELPTSDIRDITLNLLSISTGDYPNVALYLTVVDSVTNPLLTIAGLDESNFDLWEESTRITDFTVDYIAAVESGMRDEDIDVGPIDVVALLDVSSYMEPYDTVKNMMMSLVTTLVDSIDREFKVALITFTDEIKSLNDFSDDIDEVRGWAETALELTTDNPDETNGLEAISRMSDLMWTEGAQRMMIYVSAHPFATGGGYTTMGTVDYLRSMNISPLIMGPEDADMLMLADSADGYYVNIEILTSILDSLDSYLGSDVGHYAITYETPNPVADGSWRDVEIEGSVEVDDTVYTDYETGGYYAPSISGFYFSPETTYTRQGYSFRVDIKAATMMNLFDVHFVANWDPAILDLDSIKVGEFLARGASAPLNIITTGTGTVDASITRNGVLTGINGSGTIASLFFNVIAQDPTSMLGFSEVDVRDPDFVEVPTLVDSFAYIRYLSGTGGGTPGDTTDCLLCDFDCDSDIDTRDFVLLGGYWQPANNSHGDVGPGSGVAPVISTSPDGMVNFEDLFVFSRMWNWYHLTVLGHPKTGPGGTVFVSSDGKTASIKAMDMTNFGMFRLVIEFDPSRTEILSTELGAIKTGFVDIENGTIEIASARLANNGECAEIFGDVDLASISFKGDDTFNMTVIDIRDAASRVVLDGTQFTPRQYSLGRARPNPFNPTTTIEYNLPVESDVKLEIFDILGHSVDVVVEETQSAGHYRVTWHASGKDAPSGVYFYRLSAGEFSDTKRMMLIK